MKKIAIIFIIGLLFSASMAHAHSVWINAFTSHSHQPPYTIVSLGWGHSLPMDDILTSTNGRIAIERFELFDPDLKKIDLIIPELNLSEPDLETPDFDLFAADLGAQKIAMKEDSAPGVYQLSVVSKPNFYTQYIDKDGKTKLKLKPKNEVTDIKKVLMAIKYQAFAKSYVTVGEWQDPEPLGHGLEIIPRTDLSNLHVGDLVEVDVLFYGVPLNTTGSSMDFITAHSSSFGQSDSFYLMSYITNGKAQFRVQSSGQWMIGINHKEDVNKDGSLKELYGKADQIYHSASLTFIVK